MATPENESSIEELRFVPAKTVFPHIALDESLRAVIEEAYALLDSGEKYWVGEEVSEEELRTHGIKRPAAPVLAPPPPAMPLLPPVDVPAAMFPASSGWPGNCAPRVTKSMRSFAVGRTASSRTDDAYDR